MAKKPTLFICLARRGKELMRNVTLFTLTRTVCSDCILMIRIAVHPCVVALCVMAATTGTPRCSEVKPDEMKYIPIMIYGDEALVDKTVSGRDKIPYSSASRNGDNEFSC